MSRTFHWNDLQQQGKVSAGTVLPPEVSAQFYRLQIQGSPSGPTRATVLTIEHPPIAGQRYVVQGQIRYEGIQGVGFLEMWNHFPGGGQYFSRTLGEGGPMMKLHGTSPWRPFALPFDATGAGQPTRLVVNVVLEGRGVVYLGPMELTELTAAVSDIGDRPVNRLTSSVGAIAGAFVGCVGALIGLLTSLGKARRLVIAATTGLIVFGAAALVMGLVAAARSQPFSVSYPLLLLGSLACIVPLGIMPTIRRRFEEIELRTMRAHDIR